MMESSKNNMMKNINFIQKYKLFFGISFAIIFIGLIAGIVQIFVSGSMFNVGIDIAGGYSMSVEIGDVRLNNDTEKDWREKITKAAESARVGDDGRGIKVDSLQRQGSGTREGFLIRYKGVKADADEDYELFMQDLNASIREAVNKIVSPNGEFDGRVGEGFKTSASLPPHLIGRFVLALLVALLVITIYVAVRFDFVSGLATILSMLHDVLIVFALMAIFRIQLNGAFLVVVAALAIYSVNNTIISLDRIRENVKRVRHENNGFSADMGTDFANTGTNSNLTRFVNIGIISVAIVVFLLGIAVPGVRTFMLPLLIGLVSCLYSGICITPTIWAKVVNKHPDYLQRGALTTNIRHWFGTRSELRRQRKATKLATKNKNEENTSQTLTTQESIE